MKEFIKKMDNIQNHVIPQVIVAAIITGLGVALVISAILQGI